MRPPPRWQLFGVLAALLTILVPTQSAQAQGGLFDFSKDKAVCAAVTRGQTPPTAADLALPPMLGALRGIYGTLGLKEIAELRRSPGPPPESTAAIDAGQAYGFLHLWSKDPGAAGAEHKVISLFRKSDGAWVAEDLVADPAPQPGAQPAATKPRVRPRNVTLKPEFIAPLAATWLQYRGDFGGRLQPELAPEGFRPASGPKPPPAPQIDPVGQVFELPKPYMPGLYTMTTRVIGERLLAGGTTALKPTTRDLAKSTFYCRLPKGYQPGVAAGLIVWCDASPSGRPPQTFDQIADELGFIVAGAAQSGNDRLVVDRYQFALDVLATAQARYLIEPTRVYISGISGGARVCSTIAGCFPDLFFGQSPIVGLACYENVPEEMGRFWRGEFRRPPAKLFDLLKSRRIAPITGEQDMNYREITGAVKIYERDHCQIKLYSSPDMGHQMPTPERFGEALRWVDQDAATARGSAMAEAKTRLGKCLIEDGHEVKGDSVRPELIAITELAPWSQSAWSAAQSLGFSR